MVKVSVIIPVYNVDKYLSECLDSVLSQSLTDIEVICVNDGSTDDSLTILENYQSRDSRVRVFSQENRGLASARNVGMDNSSGDYITFIDSDDYFVKDALKTIYEITCEKQADFTLFKLLNFDDKTGETSPKNYFDMPFLRKFEGDIFNHGDVGERLFNIPVTAPGKLFKREFINKLRFPENLLFEDTPFVLEAIFMAERMCFLDEYLYMRRIHKESITQSNFSRFSDCIVIFNIMAEITKNYGEYDLYKEKLFTQKVSNTYARFSQVTDEYKEDFYNQLKKDFKDKQGEFEEVIDFDKVKPRAKRIYYAALDSKNYRQFVKLVENDSSSLSKIFKNLFRK